MLSIEFQSINIITKEILDDSTAIKLIYTEGIHTFTEIPKYCINLPTFFCTKG